MIRSKPLLSILLFASMFLAACGSADESEMRKTDADMSRVVFAKVRAAPTYAYTARVAELARTGNYYLEPRPLSKAAGMAVIKDVVANFKLPIGDLRYGDNTMPEPEIVLTPNAPVAERGQLKAYCSEYITGRTSTGWIVIFSEVIATCVHPERLWLAGGLSMNGGAAGYSYTAEEISPPPGVAIEFRDLVPNAVYVLDISLSLDPDEVKVAEQWEVPTDPVIALAGLPGNFNPGLSATDGHVMLSFTADAPTVSLFLTYDIHSSKTVYLSYGKVLFHSAALIKVTK